MPGLESVRSDQRGIPVGLSNSKTSVEFDKIM